METRWTCVVSGLDSEGKKTDEAPKDLTVGAKFALSCEGPSVSLNKDSLVLELPKENRYQLRLLETKSLTENSAEFVATSWVPGEVALKDPILTDGEARVSLGDIKFSVASVLQPESAQEPYPPWGPLSLTWPFSVWASLALGIILIGSFVAMRMRRVLRRKRLLRLLEKNPIAVDPYHHFNKELRRLARQIPVISGAWNENDRRTYLDEVDSAIRWYLARTLILPVFDRPTRDILSDLKRLNKKMHGELRREFTVTFTELERARRAPAQVSVEDAQQIMELARGLADRVRERLGAEA